MSDDDLWPQQGSGEHSDERSDDHPGAAEEPTPGRVGDETQPITGTTSTPPPASPTPPSPSYRTPTYESPTGPGAVPPPQNPFGQHGQPGPYGNPQSPYGGQPYSPPPNPYAPANEYGSPHNPYGGPYQPAYAGGALPDHPSATTAMVLGIIGLVGLVFCGGITLVLSPFAWAVGARAVREIDGSPGRYGGRDRAQGGKIMGIIGTVLLILGVLAIIAFVVLAVAVGTNDPSPAFPSRGLQNG